MPIFGQVWLWSSLAFLLGAVLCWALVALPARRRVGELEAELTARARRQSPASSGQSSSRSLSPVGSRRQHDEEDFDPRRLLVGNDRELEPAESDEAPLTRAYAMAGSRSGTVTAPPEIDTELSDGPRATATQYINVSGTSTLEAPPEVPAGKKDRGWFDDPQRRDENSPAATTVLPQVPAEPVDSRLVDDIEPATELVAPEADRDADRGTDRDTDNGGTVFSQRTHPIPGELIRQLDESDTSGPAHALVDDLDDSDGGVDERGILAELDASGESKHQLSQDPEVTSVLAPTPAPPATGSDHGAHDRTEVVPAHTAETTDDVQDEAVSASGRHGAAGDHSTPGAEEPKNMPGVTVQAEPPKNTLPKRVPSKPPSRTPFGVQTSTPASAPGPAASTTTVEPAAAQSANEAPRALFEPIVPAGDGPPVPPPPHRVRAATPAPARASAQAPAPTAGRGPFGPGSAMPGPGGTAPSPEYTVKASASAMRYCTQESDSYERTMAEVWFLSAADAERAGFRQVG